MIAVVLTMGSLLLHVLLVLQDMLQMLLDSKSANENNLGLSWWSCSYDIKLHMVLSHFLRNH